MTGGIPLRLMVNRKAYDVTAEPRRLLADVLRSDCGLTGTKLGCEQGICGACTVLVDGEPVRSCLLFAWQVDDGHVTTVEGDGEAGVVTRAREAVARHQAFQCGYCTAGFIVL